MNAVTPEMRGGGEEEYFVEEILLNFRQQYLHFVKIDFPPESSKGFQQSTNPITTEVKYRINSRRRWKRNSAAWIV